MSILMMKWILLLLVIIGGYYAWNYTVDTNVENAKFTCIESSDIINFKLIEENGLKYYVYKDWQIAILDSLNESENKFYTAFNISENSGELVYVWSKGYPYDSDKLAEDTTSLLTNKRVISNTKMNDYGIELTRDISDYKLGNVDIRQDTFAYTKDNVGYVVVLRSMLNNYQANEDLIRKTVCSIINN